MASCDRKELEKREGETLSKYAARSSDPTLSRREHQQKPDRFRTAYQRDYTRIIHSRAFRRLRHKTQVFISPRNDHLCTRLEHSLHVASISATIARALGLNVDLVAAIAVGHDLGHAPFGHQGESILSEQARKHGLSFSHELHSLRIVDHLDSPYGRHAGLNLTFAVRDGIACHYGEGFERQLRPDREKTPSALVSMARGQAQPATLEGCVVRWADKIAYLGRDLEDAIELRLLRKRDVSAVVRGTLGTSNKQIIDSLVSDLIRNSHGDCLVVSTRVHKALNALYSFNMKHIYKSKIATLPVAKVKLAVPVVFDVLLDEITKAQKTGDSAHFQKLAEEKPPGWTYMTLRDFLDRDVRTRWLEEHPAQLVLDFIAGMTDSFFLDAFYELVFPQSVV